MGHDRGFSPPARHRWCGGPPWLIVLLLFLFLAARPTAAPGYANTPADWELFGGIGADDPVRAEIALSKGASVNEARNNQGESPLMAACSRGNLEIVRLLVERGAEINLPVSTGLTYTSALARSIGSMGVLMYLIVNGGDIHGNDKVEPLLLEVARSSNLMVARYLLVKGADANETGHNGWSALMSAVTCCQGLRGSMEMVRLLVEWGANVDMKDADGQTALMKTTDQRIAAYLLSKGADVNAVDGRGNPVLSRLLETTTLPEQEIASLARLFLEKGARTEVLNSDQRTPLMIAIWRSLADIALLLLDHGAAVDAADPMGTTALTVAAESHQADLIKLCLDRGANPNFRDLLGNTPLIHLFNGAPCDSLGEDIKREMDLLLAAGADPNLPDPTGATVISVLEERGCSADITAYLRSKSGSKPPAAVPAAPPLKPEAPSAEAVATAPASALPGPAPGTGAPAPAPAGGVEEGAAAPPPKLSKSRAREIRIARRVEQLSFNDRKLYLAITRRDYPAMDEALAQGVDLNQQSEYLPDGTFLMSAVVNRDPKLVAYLLSKGADANLRDFGGQTPMSAAVGNRTCMKLLFGKGADVNALSPSGEIAETALAKAVRVGDLESAKLLISLGADVNRRDSTGSPPLMQALFLPELAMARLLVESGADVNIEVPGDWTTPLMNAVVANDRGVVEFLVAAGADVNAKNIRGYSPLLLAVELADRSIIGLILAKGADINLAGYGGTTALLEAVTLNRGLQIVEFLLARGAAVNASDDNGITSLMIAVIRGQNDVVKLLMLRGADAWQVDRQGKSALSYARERGNSASEGLLLEGAKPVAAQPGQAAAANPLKPEQLLVKAVREGDPGRVGELLDQGVRITVRDEESRRPLIALAVESGNREMVDLLLSRGADLNDAGGTSSIHVAVEAGQKAMIEHLLSAGARVNILAEGGSSPLHAAVRLAGVSELGAAADPARQERADLYRDIVLLLLNAGADANAGTLQTVDLGDDSLWNPFHLAAYLGSPRLIELLLRTAQIDARTANGNTPLHLAVLTLSGESVTQVISLLLERGADPNEKNSKGNSVLQEALVWWDSWPGWGTETQQDGVTRPRWLIMVQKLLEGGAGVNEVGEYGAYPIHTAAEAGLTELAELLIEQGARVNVTDRDGLTPLFLAVRQNRTAMVQLLLRRGANRNPVNREGETPLDEARRQKRNGSIEAVEIEKLLLASGAEPGRGADQGATLNR